MGGSSGGSATRLFLLLLDLHLQLGLLQCGLFLEAALKALKLPLDVLLLFAPILID